MKDSGHHGEAGEKWTFDASVTEVFEDMLRRSIPQYDVMRQAVLDVSLRFMDAHQANAGLPKLLDLGASRGDSVAQIIDRLGSNALYYAIETSAPMLAVLRDRFKEWMNMGDGFGKVVTVIDGDLRSGLPRLPNMQVVQSILTLQFVPIEYRQRVLRESFDLLSKNGAFLLVEKVLGASSNLHDIQNDIYWSMKREHGYSQEEIDRKRFALEGSLVSVTAEWNRQMLLDAGFSQVDCFWRWMNFAAWVAVK